MTGKKIVKGIKHDKGKKDPTLVDAQVLEEIDIQRSMLRELKLLSSKKDEEHVFGLLREMVTKRMYVLAAAIVLKVVEGVSIDQVQDIYDKGAAKYGKHNWKLVRPIDRYMAAAYRHLRLGINNDDFGLPHLAHFCWNMMALRWFELRGIRFESDKVELRSVEMEKEDA